MLSLTWIGNSLYMGKVCVAGISKMNGLYVATYANKFQGEYGFFEATIGTFATESEARLALESFIRTQAGEPLPILDHQLTTQEERG